MMSENTEQEKQPNGVADVAGNSLADDDEYIGNLIENIINDVNKYSNSSKEEDAIDNAKND